MSIDEVFYVLEGGAVREVDEATHAAFWDREDPGRVGLTFVGDVEVSTVFLPRPAVAWPRDRPLLFETSLFGPSSFIGVVGRYATWAEALAGHKRTDDELRLSRPH